MTTADEYSSESARAKPEPGESGVEDALAPRLRVIEALPLAERAEGYVQLHDEMRDLLEGGGAPQTQG